MPELFFQESDQNDLVEQMRNLNEAFEVNLAQVVRYLVCLHHASYMNMCKLSYENHTTSKINRKSLERILKKAQISFQKVSKTSFACLTIVDYRSGKDSFFS